MLAWRWSLGVVAVLIGGGWLALALLGDSFRSSLGASSVDVITQFAPVLVAALILASVLLPGHRLLLHVTALVVAAACVGLVFLLRESVVVGGLGLLYGGAWFGYYAKSL